MKLEDQQAVQLYFTDETGFKLTPDIPYGWIPEGEQWSIRSAKDRVCNFFGLRRIFCQHLKKFFLV